MVNFCTLLLPDLPTNPIDKQASYHYENYKTDYVVHEQAPFQHFCTFRIPETDPDPHTVDQGIIRALIGIRFVKNRKQKTAQRGFWAEFPRVKIPGLMVFIRLFWLNFHQPHLNRIPCIAGTMLTIPGQQIRRLGIYRYLICLGQDLPYFFYSGFDSIGCYL